MSHRMRLRHELRTKLQHSQSLVLMPSKCHELLCRSPSVKLRQAYNWRTQGHECRRQKVAIATLNKIMELELAGVVRYTHYSLMVYGYNRIPIVSWLKGNPDESLAHAYKAGELVTLLGGHPSLKFGPLLETEQHDLGDLLERVLIMKRPRLSLYYELLKNSEGKSVLLEEYAREMIMAEELHLDEVNKMLRKPGDIHEFHD